MKLNKNDGGGVVSYVGRASDFRPDLQGLRAVAVVSVVLNHLIGWPVGGFVGVDVFFVLSGFLITGLLLRETNRTGSLSFANFYRRRVRRIIPAALLVLATTATVGLFLFPAIRAKDTIVDVLWAALSAANWRFERVGADYFEEGLPPSAVQHFWSLAIEEQFYFVWPAVILAIFLVTDRIGSPRSEHYRNIALVGSVGMVITMSFGWALAQSSSRPTTAYFSTFTRVWELGVGAAVAILAPYLTRLPRTALRPAIAYVGIIGVVLSLFVVTPDMAFPGPWALLPVLSTALILGAFVGTDVYGSAPLTNRFAQYFGSTSYSLYLWHWPVIVFLGALMPNRGLPFYIAASIVFLALSDMSYRFFESPIHRSRWLEPAKGAVSDRPAGRWVTPRAWNLLGGLVVVSIVASLVGITMADDLAGRGESNETLLVDTPMPSQDPCLGGPALGDPACRQFGAGELVPTIDSFSKDTQGAFSCWRDEGEAMSPCTIGSARSDAVRLALIGDSHAATLLPGLARRLEESNWALTSYVGYGCQWQSPAPGDCEDEMVQLQDLLLSEEPYDAIVTTSGRKYGGATKAAAVEAYRAAWSAVSARGTRVVVVGDNPSVSADLIACVTRFGGDPFDCGTERTEALAEVDPLIDAANLTDGAELVDLTRYYCTPDRCPAVVGNVIVYRDTGGHVTATFAETLAPFIVAGIRRALE